VASKTRTQHQASFAASACISAKTASLMWREQEQVIRIPRSGFVKFCPPGKRESRSRRVKWLEEQIEALNVALPNVGKSHGPAGHPRG